VWQHVLLDGLFPVNSGRALAYAQPARGQLWVMLLEKAFSKLYGCFEAVDGGTGDEALRVLTGQVCGLQIGRCMHSCTLSMYHTRTLVPLKDFRTAASFDSSI
jgi:hypothetical protein